jgi:hypothetical protein
MVFSEVIHLRCTIHICRNIKEKLVALKIPQTVITEFIADIFGKQVDSHFEIGLIDSQSTSAFWNSLHKMKEL